MTHPIACPESLQPELKACAVRLVPIAQAAIQAEAEPSQIATSPGVGAQSDRSISSVSK